MKEQNILVYPPQGKGAPFRFVYTPDKPTPPEVFASALRSAFAQDEDNQFGLLARCDAIDSVVAKLGGSWKLMEYDATIWL